MTCLDEAFNGVDQTSKTPAGGDCSGDGQVYILVKNLLMVLGEPIRIMMSLK